MFVMYFFSVIVAVFSLFCGGLFATEGKTVYVYDYEVKGRTVQKTQSLTEDSQGFHLRMEGDDGGVEVDFRPTETRRFFSFSPNEGKTHEILREGDRLTVFTGKERKLVRQYNPKAPWIQDFNFGLKDFVQSPQKRELNFCIVRPSDLSLHDMRAEKGEVKEMTFGDQQKQVLEVVIRLRGAVKKFLWKADLLFDAETGDLLQYKANDGPLTSMQIRTLISKQIEQMGAEPPSEKAQFLETVPVSDHVVEEGDVAKKTQLVKGQEGQEGPGQSLPSSQSTFSEENSEGGDLSSIGEKARAE